MITLVASVSKHLLNVDALRVVLQQKEDALKSLYCVLEASSLELIVHRLCDSNVLVDVLSDFLFLFRVPFLLVGFWAIPCLDLSVHRPRISPSVDLKRPHFAFDPSHVILLT
jgi:hypothetical protein